MPPTRRSPLDGPVRSVHPSWIPDPPRSPPERDLRLAARLAMEAVRGPMGDVRAIGGGAVNWVFLAEAGDASVVVRLARTDDVAAALEEYRKEAWCLDRAGGVGVPGPRALSTGRRDGRAYMILTRVVGESGDGVPMDVLGVWKELGGYASRTARVPVSGFGNRLAPDGSGRFVDSFHASWRDRIEYNIDRLTPSDPFVEIGIYEPSHREEIRHRFESMLMDDWSLALCHGDLVPGNTVVDGVGEVHLMDWGSAAVDAWPESVVADLRRLLYLGQATPAEVGWFLDGMDLPDSGSARFRRRVEHVMLLRAFDVGRWAIARRPPHLDAVVAAAHQLWHAVRFGAHTG